jgi:hypothetical protein
MNPVEALPPGMPLTLQETLLFVEPVTVALRLCEVPNSKDAVAGDTATLTGGVDGAGAGVGDVDATGPAIPPLQPAIQAAVARRPKISRDGECGNSAAQELMTMFGERGRMQRRNAGEGPATAMRTPGKSVCGISPRSAVSCTN